MSTKADRINETATENSIERRTRRAATESMTVVHSGRNAWTVYSGETSEYEVSIRDGAWMCSCPDAEHNLSDGQQCKHARRTRMEIGDMEIPDLGRAVPSDVEIMTGAVDVDDEPEAAIEVEPTEAAARAVVTDGGRVIEDADPQGSDAEDECPHGHPECEGVHSERDRPILCYDCWGEYASA